MGNLYPGTSVSGYNSNPPPDDGSTGTNNLVTWSGIKTKLGDPLNTFAASVDSNLTTAFGKTLDGAAVATTSGNYAAGASDQGKLIKATASGITITTPDATVVGAPFMFVVNNQSTGTIILAGGGSGPQTIDGQTTQVLKPGAGCIIKTDGSNWYTFGLKAPQITGGTTPPYGFDMPVNMALASSVSSGILTVAVKTLAGNDPSASDPVLIPFNTQTGGVTWANVTSALSINTNAIGATLGVANGNPFRLWLVALNNNGTPVLALWHSGAGASGSSPQLAALNEGISVTSVAISASATSSATFYSPNGVTVTGAGFRIIGYLEWNSGLSTAGNYTSGPSKTMLFGPGLKKPGDIIQSAFGTSTSLVITVTNPANLVRVEISGSASVTANGTSVNNAFSVIAKRNSTNLATLSFYNYLLSGQQFTESFCVKVLDNPFASATYAMTISLINNVTGGAFGTGYIVLDEIMS